MSFEKKSLYRFNMPYALGTMEKDGQSCVVAATEDQGPIVVVPPPYDHAEVLVDGPGGCMSLVSHPDRPGELYAIMGCFLGYQFHGGALYRVTTGPTKSQKLVDLPFAHRMEIVERGDDQVLLIANLAASKDSPEDWSRPGTLYALPLQGKTVGTMAPILEGIHKNHGFWKGRLDGKRRVLISGTEGLFALNLEAAGSAWFFEQWLTYEVSEVAVFDLDGDGQDELVTIEPFHGSALCVYHQSPTGWQKVWEAEISYGHCVLADRIDGKPSLLVSNRSGSKDLLLFQFDGSGRFAAPRREVVDAGVGAANMLVVHQDGRERIFATNQVQGELVRYERA